MKTVKYDPIIDLKDLDTIRTRLEQAKQFRMQTRDEVFKIIDVFYRGKQWGLSNVQDVWKMTPNANHIFAKVHTLVSSLAGGDYKGELMPVEEETKNIVLELQQALHMEFELMHHKHYVKLAITDAVKLGLGITHIYYDPYEKRANAKGAIKFKHYDPSKVYFDPNALKYDEENLNYMYTIDRLTLAEFLANKDFKNKEVIKKEVSDEEEDQNVNIEGEYEYSGKGDPLDRGEIYGDRDYETFQDKTLVLKTYYERYFDNGVKIRIIYFVNNIPVRVIKDFPVEQFPFAVYPRYEIPDSPYAMGDAELILENAKIYNKLQALIFTHVAMSATPQQLVQQSAGLNVARFQAERGKFGSVYTITGNAQNVISNVPMPQLPNVSMEALKLLKEDMDDTIGTGDHYTGQSSGSLQTKGAIERVQERATLRDKERYESFQYYIERLTKLVIQFMYVFYKGERYYVQKLDNKEYSFRKVNFDEIRDIPYLFYIDVMEHAPLSEQQMSEETKWLITMQGQYGDSAEVPYITPEEAMERLHIGKKETILDRMKNDRANLKAIETDFLLKAVQMAEGMQMPKEEAITQAMMLWNGMDMVTKQKLIEAGKSDDGVLARLYQANMLTQLQQALQGVGTPMDQNAITNPNISPQQKQGNVPSPAILQK